jgi:hypothetical protein
MADVTHSTLTGSDLHEPKGVASASSGQIYVADGLGSGAWEDKVGGAEVKVNAESDLPTAVAGVITLAANTTYTFGSDVSTANRFVVGDNTVIRGHDERVTTLTYTGSGVMFTGSDTDFKCKDIRLSCTLGTLYSFENTAGNEGTAFVIFNWVEVSNVATLGTATSLAALAFVNVNFSSITTDGITLAGASGGAPLVMDTCTINISTGTAIDFGSSTSTVGPLITNTTFLIATGTTGISGLASSGNLDTGASGTISFNKFIGAGTNISTISPDDTQWFFIGNNNIADTRPDGLLSTSSNTVTISTINTPVLLDGTGTYTVERSSQFTGTTAGRLTYNGEKDTVVPITANVGGEPTVGTNIDYTFYIAINGSVVTNSLASTTVDAGNPKNTSLLWQASLSQNDYVELWVECTTGTNDFQCNSAILRVN